MIELSKELESLLFRVFRETTRTSDSRTVWSGGLGTTVFLRIKLFDARDERYPLESILEYLLSLEEHPCLRLGLLWNPWIGARCLLCSILVRRQEREDAKILAESILDQLKVLSSHSNEDVSILFGLAGGLQVIWYLRNELEDSSLGSELAISISRVLLQQGHGTAAELWQDSSVVQRLAWKWKGWPYLGAATGMTGVLYALLGHTPHEWKILEQDFPNVRQVLGDTIDGIAQHQLYETGNLKDSMTGYEEDERFLGWTHGVLGYCFLLILAFDVYGDEKYVYWAIELADRVLWDRREHPQELGLAKGLVGIAYFFLALARVDVRQTNLWIERSKRLAEMALSLQESQDTSLFDGMGGLVSLLIDLRHPQDAAFPFFEIPIQREFLYRTCPEDHPSIFQRAPKDSPASKATAPTVSLTTNSATPQRMLPRKHYSTTISPLTNPSLNAVDSPTAKTTKRSGSKPYRIPPNSFFQESIVRVQRAEASWMFHYGTREQYLEFRNGPFGSNGIKKHVRHRSGGTEKFLF